MNGSVVAAVLTAAVAVVIAVVSQLETSRRARSDRAYERRRAALVDVQEAALVLRDTLRQFGGQASAEMTSPVGTTRPAGERVRVVSPSPALDQARGRVDVCGVRLEPRAGSRAVATALDAWRHKADEHFLSPDDLAAAAEQQAWRDLNLLVAAALHE